ncbi:MerR family DNA-binding transcriptional regulator [Arthrobacter sp. GMC3]|uniref:MerR family DNA-binding transcriptional regulator n=1 Tax=Arthrobacter sp. GMC3 TaxID=2058894 RepID=UPI0015E495AF|nr:MerR family DNA-binding transcriptional regulator [Arthrobacter sp. GMC3]
MTKREVLTGEELLTHAEAAARIGISTKTLDRYAVQGKVKPLRLPSGYRRYTCRQIDALVTGGSAE